MASPYRSELTRLGLGLNLVDAPELMLEGQARVLENYRLLGSGRITPRKAARQLSDCNEQILGGIPYSSLSGVAGIMLTRTSGSVVRLYKVDANGALTLVGNLAGWSGVASSVVVHMAEINSIVFICDEGRTHGLTLYDPNLYTGTATALFQPTFDFDLSGGGHAKAKPGLVKGHSNHLWMFGYGDETDADRPEYGRFSYLGLVADGHGAGDAGTGGATGSTDLFDAEDAVPIVPRGDQIVGASSAPGRLLVCSPREAFLIFGSDADSWRKDKLATRGLVNSKAIGEAAEMAWWMSPQGPCRYPGGGVFEDLTESPTGSKIKPLLREIDMSSVFFTEAPEEGQARFYYRRKDDVTAGCPRSLNFDIHTGQWLGDHSSIRATCAFRLQPTGLEGPSASPSGLAHSEVTNRSGLASWTPGDTGPGVRTHVYRAPDNAGVAGTYQFITTLESGASRYRHTSLEPTTKYWTKIQEVRNGQASTAQTGHFTTVSASTVLLPVQISLINRPYLVQQGNTGKWYPAIAISWDLTQVGIKLHIERGAAALGPFTEIGLVTETFFLDRNVTSGTTYHYRFKAEDADGNLSGYSAIPNIAVAVVPYADDPVGTGLTGEGSTGGNGPNDE